MGKRVLHMPGVWPYRWAMCKADVSDVHRMAHDVSDTTCKACLRALVRLGDEAHSRCVEIGGKSPALGTKRPKQFLGWDPIDGPGGECDA